MIARQTGKFVSSVFLGNLFLITRGLMFVLMIVEMDLHRFQGSVNNVLPIVNIFFLFLGLVCDHSSDPNINTCEFCALGYFLNIAHLCTMDCGDGFFGDLAARKCIPCQVNFCKDCRAQVNKCSQCDPSNPHLHSQSDACVSTCPPGMTDIISGISKCQNCKTNNCKCPFPIYLTLKVKNVMQTSINVRFATLAGFSYRMALHATWGLLALPDFISRELTA